MHTRKIHTSSCDSAGFQSATSLEDPGRPYLSHDKAELHGVGCNERKNLSGHKLQPEEQQSGSRFRSGIAAGLDVVTMCPGQMSACALTPAPGTDGARMRRGDTADIWMALKAITRM